MATLFPVHSFSTAFACFYIDPQTNTITPFPCWNKQHLWTHLHVMKSLGANYKKVFSLYFSPIFLLFPVLHFSCKNMKKAYFDQLLEFTPPKACLKLQHWISNLSFQKCQLMPKFLFIWLLKVCCRRLLEARPGTSCPQERAWTLQQHDQDQRLHRGVRHQETQHRQETCQGWSNALLVGWWDPGLVRCWGCPVFEWYPTTEWWC